MSLSDADAYDRFMGRYSRPLAVPFADFAERNIALENSGLERPTPRSRPHRDHTAPNFWGFLGVVGSPGRASATSGSAGLCGSARSRMLVHAAAGRV